MLASAADERPLIEDWIIRRQRLSTPEDVPEQHRLAQLRVLDYLIARYADSPEASRPARFASPASFFSNGRLIVVHHHLGRGKIAGVKSRAEATRRVGDILRHLQRVHEDEPDAVAPHNDFPSWVDELDQQQPEPTSAWQDIRRQLWGPPLGTLISRAVKEHASLPPAIVAYLGRRLSRQRHDVEAADWLLKCRPEGVADHVARAWGARIEKGWCDAITLKLRTYLASQVRGLDGVRTQLAHSNPEVRLAAIDLLAEAGTLDDVALLSDLVSLPPDDDEDPQERKALLDAMWRIAHRD